MISWILREWEHGLDFGELWVVEGSVNVAGSRGLISGSENVMADAIWSSSSAVIFKLVFSDQYME